MTHVLIGRLAALCPLGETERNGIESAIVRTFEVQAGSDISRTGVPTATCHVLLSGMAASYRQLPNGSRPITQFWFPGDLLDLNVFAGTKLTRDVGAIGQCVIGSIPHRALQDLSREFPAVALALWCYALAEAAVLQEWVVNGRRSALKRIAHLFCEVFTRLQSAGFAGEIKGRATFSWPLKQQGIADATGMSVVHVNRSLQELRRRGLVELLGDRVTIVDWSSLVALGDFDADYLSPC